MDTPRMPAAMPPKLSPEDRERYRKRLINSSRLEEQEYYDIVKDSDIRGESVPQPLRHPIPVQEDGGEDAPLPPTRPNTKARMSLVLRDVGYEGNGEKVEDIEYLGQNDMHELHNAYGPHDRYRTVYWRTRAEEAERLSPRQLKDKAEEAKRRAAWEFPKHPKRRIIITERSTPADVKALLELPPNNSARDLTKIPRCTEHGMRLHFNTNPYGLPYDPNLREDLLDLYRSPQALKEKRRREAEKERRRKADEEDDDLYRMSQAVGEKRAREDEDEDGGSESPSPSRKGNPTEEATEAPIVGGANSPQTEGEEEPRPLPSGREMRSADGRQKRSYKGCG